MLPSENRGGKERRENRMDILNKIQKKYPANKYCAVPETGSVLIKGTAANRIKKYIDRNQGWLKPNFRFDEADAFGNTVTTINYDGKSKEYAMSMSISAGAGAKNITVYFQGDGAEDSILWLLLCLLTSKAGNELRRSILALDGRYVEFICLSHRQQKLAAKLRANIDWHLKTDSEDIADAQKKLRTKLLKYAAPLVSSAPVFSSSPISDESFGDFFGFLGRKKSIEKIKLSDLAQKLYTGSRSFDAEYEAYARFIEKSPEFNNALNEAGKNFRQIIYSEKLIWANQLLNQLAAAPEEETRKPDMDISRSFKLSVEELKTVFDAADKEYREGMKSKVEALFLGCLCESEGGKIAAEGEEALRKLGEIQNQLKAFCKLGEGGKYSRIRWNRLSALNDEITELDKDILADIPFTGWLEEDFSRLLDYMNSNSTVKQHNGVWSFVLCSPAVVKAFEDHSAVTKRYGILTDNSIVWAAFTRPKKTENMGDVDSE